MKCAYIPHHWCNIWYCGSGNHTKIGVVDTSQCHILYHIFYSVIMEYTSNGHLIINTDVDMWVDIASYSLAITHSSFSIGLNKVTFMHRLYSGHH